MMPIDPSNPQFLKPDSSVIRWLLDSDPAIRWQVMGDLTDAPADEVAAERARVASEGWGAQLLALQGADGSWAGVAFNQELNSTMHILTLLREFGLDPASDAAQRAVGLVRDRVRWRGWDWNGRWPLETRYPGEMPIEMDEGEGQPSRWNTLRALRVLDWFTLYTTYNTQCYGGK